MGAGGTGIILQARMGSSRFPGKVLAPLAGKPMIQRVVERLRRCETTDQLILATSDSSDEQPLVDWATQFGVSVFRGSEHDVLDRYYQCARTFGIAHIIRVTGDNPFLDSRECDRLVGFYRERNLDHAVTLSGASEGYPYGVWAEVFSFRALQRSWSEGQESHHREHVNEYMLENPALFRQEFMSPPAEKRASDLSLTVDTREDYETANELFSAYADEDPDGQLSVEWAIRASGSLRSAAGQPS
jgi:spore coat polysaccharide biosynthesis protein SpsF